MAENEGYVNDETQVTSFANDNNVDDVEKETDNHYENEVKVDISEKENIGPYAGMPKDVLLLYSRQKRYVWARDILTAIVILIILILLALVIAIIVISPPCLEFWQTSPIYKIYPKSFKSSNEDGYGDFKGIVEKLDYINEDLGINVIALDSVYESPKFEEGYDVSDFRNVDKIFGTMEDMENLIVEVHDRGMKIVMNFIPNHSSDKHEWFLASSNTTHPQHEKYKDYYVWVYGSNETDIPNNWRTELDDQSAWTWNTDRQQFYYHSHSSSQPDLNLRSTKVRKELKDILRFWLEKGIDGFICNGVGHLLEAEHLRDNPLIDNTKPASKNNLYHDYTKNYEGIHDIVVEWRELLDEYSTEPGVYRFLETQTTGADYSTILRYYGTKQSKEADFPTNELLLNTEGGGWNAENLGSKIMEWMSNMPEGKWPNWVLSDQGNSRVSTRAGDDLSRCAAMMSTTLPGTAALYYGDEIGMIDLQSISIPQDSLDLVRSPMQWTADDNAGFCKNCTPWISVDQNHLTGINVENQTGQQDSMLTLYKSLISLRNDMIFQRGYFCMLQTRDNDVLAYVRELSGLTSMMILLNFGDTTSGQLNITSMYSNLPPSGRVKLFTGSDENFKTGDEVTYVNLNLPPKSGMILSYDQQSMFNERDDMAENCFVNLKVCYNSALQILQTC